MFSHQASRGCRVRVRAVAAPEQLNVNYEKNFPLDSDNNVQVLTTWPVSTPADQLSLHFLELSTHSFVAIHTGPVRERR